MRQAVLDFAEQYNDSVRVVAGGLRVLETPIGILTMDEYVASLPNTLENLSGLHLEDEEYQYLLNELFV